MNGPGNRLSDTKPGLVAALTLAMFAGVGFAWEFPPSPIETAALANLAVSSAAEQPPPAGPEGRNPSAPPAPPDGSPRKGQPGERARDAMTTVRERIERRREQFRQHLEAADRLLKRLEGGADPADIRRELEQIGRPSDQRGDGGEGPRGGPGVGPRPGQVPDRGGQDRPGDRPGDRRGGPGPALVPGGPTGPGPGGGGAMGGGGGGSGNPEERERLQNHLREFHPELAREIEELRQTNPVLVQRLGELGGPRMRELPELRERNRRTYDQRVGELRGGVRVVKAFRAVTEARAGADAAKAEAARAELRKALENQFDLRVAGRRLEIEQLAERVTGMKTDLDRMVERKPQAIDQMERGLLDGSNPRPARPGRGDKRGEDGAPPPPPPPPGP